jgi:hypothetical protein
MHCTHARRICFVALLSTVELQILCQADMRGHTGLALGSLGRGLRKPEKLKVFASERDTGLSF